MPGRAVVAPSALTASSGSVITWGRSCRHDNNDPPARRVHGHPSRPCCHRAAPARHNPLRTRADWDAARRRDAGPGAFHGAIARRELHWFDPSLGTQGAWIRFEPEAGGWSGVDARSGAPVAVSLCRRPRALGPRLRRSRGAVLPLVQRRPAPTPASTRSTATCWPGFGAEAALFFEGDRWDQSLDGGRGGPVVSYRGVAPASCCSRSRSCALALRRLGLAAGDRVAINMPNIPEQVFWTEACKRLGIVYTPVFGGFSDKTLVGPHPQRRRARRHHRRRRLSATRRSSRSRRPTPIRRSMPTCRPRSRWRRSSARCESLAERSPG